MRFFKRTNIFITALLSVASATCYDGKNGGCSHYCSGSVCSCPPCWTLTENGKTCRFEAGKALVTCTATGAEVIIDKCAVPGVDPSKIHLRSTESSCAAIEEDADSWKIFTGFFDCGTKLSFSEDKFALQNTLMIGNCIKEGLIVSRKYEIDFTCSYNNVAEASASIRASNVLHKGITFDINDAQPTDFSFDFELEFYENDEFNTKADLVNGAVQPGSLLFGKVAPTSIGESLEFSVRKCTVEDKNIGQSLAILDTCPLEAVNFEFKESQSDQTAVKFSFQSFVFPTSADDTVIDVSCKVNICQKNSLECLKLCPTTLIGSTPHAPAIDTHLGTIKSAAYSSFQVSIYCASAIEQPSFRSS